MIFKCVNNTEILQAAYWYLNINADMPVHILMHQIAHS